MAMKIRLARGGSKKRPFYRIVAADSRMPRDGRFIERLGTYNPLLPKDSEERVKMNVERIQYWMGQGAQPTDRIARMLEAAGVVPAKTRANPKQALPGEKANKRAEEKAAKAAAATEAAASPAPAAAEVPAEEPAADVAEEPAADVAEEPAAKATEDAAAGDAEAGEKTAGKAAAE
jgi:small subunit ribosomal protein S16